MEVRVESAAGYSVPPGCYVGVRVGDILKQGRYEPQRSYHFPAMERRRNAKIDIYRHVGSCIIAVDPEAKSSHEVSVASSDPTVPEMKLKVNVQSTNVDPGKLREARSKQVKNQAKDYLAKFAIEEKLSEAVKALLKEQPADPTDFLCRFLTRGSSLPTSPAGGAQQAQAPSPAPVTASTPVSTAKHPHPLAPVTASVKSEAPAAAEAPAANPSEQAAPKPETSLKPEASLQPADVSTEKGMSQLRLQARDVLVKASADGSLSGALKEVRTDDKVLKDCFEGLPAALDKASVSEVRAMLAGLPAAQREKLSSLLAEAPVKDGGAAPDDLEALRQDAKATLLAAAGDGSLDAALGIGKVSTETGIGDRALWVRGLADLAAASAATNPVAAANLAIAAAEIAKETPGVAAKFAPELAAAALASAKEGAASAKGLTIASVDIAKAAFQVA